MQALPRRQHRFVGLFHFFAASAIGTASVRDCEAIRQALIGHKDDPDQRKWTILGQSFGGFCAFTYLSFFPESLKEVFTTGGIPPLLLDDPVGNYEATAS